ncbi:MAG: phosphatase PAP2 family protein [Sphingobacteriales bacterium]|nr:phosphatase PAP2 family protein [Sphingobacteriales bacterium]
MKLKISIISSLISLLALSLVLSVNQMAFSAIFLNNSWTNIAYLLTESAGINGTLLGIFIASFLYTINEIGYRKKILVFSKAILGLILIISLFAAINEHLTKPYFKYQRPSHVYLLNKLNMQTKLDSIYQLSAEERENWFRQHTTKEAKIFTEIKPTILEHWLQEAGYSFPSGHTFNAFLLACIFSFGIANNSKSKGLQNASILPFIWATGVGISRVAIGAHNIVDVLTGATLGILIGNLLLYVDYTRNWITHKKL